MPNKRILLPIIGMWLLSFSIALLFLVWTDTLASLAIPPSSGYLRHTFEFAFWFVLMIFQLEASSSALLGLAVTVTVVLLPSVLLIYHGVKTWLSGGKWNVFCGFCWIYWFMALLMYGRGV